MTKYSLYVDDCGASKPGTRDAFQYFGLGGVLIESDKEAEIIVGVNAFKDRWNILHTTPLHGAEIRAKKENFRWLARVETEVVVQFKTELLELLESLPIIIHGCITHREGYWTRYKDKHKNNTWDMRKSATSILIERVVKYLTSVGGTSLEVFFERCGQAEDNTFRQAYQHLRTEGHPFNPLTAAQYAPLTNDQLETILAPTPNVRDKNTVLLQVADLCLFPVATARNGFPTPALDRLTAAGRVIDGVTEGPILEMGIKYYCFD